MRRGAEGFTAVTVAGSYPLADVPSISSPVVRRARSPARITQSAEAGQSPRLDPIRKG